MNFRDFTSLSVIFRPKLKALATSFNMPPLHSLLTSDSIVMMHMEQSACTILREQSACCFDALGKAVFFFFFVVIASCFYSASLS